MIYMRNIEKIVLKTNIGFVTTALHAKDNRNRIGHERRFVTSALHAKYCRNRIGNEHRVCNHWFTWDTAEIVLGTNIDVATIDLHTKYCRNRIGNEHRVCNHWFTCEILQNRIGNFHATYNRNRTGNEHRVCNLCFTCQQILQKSHWQRTQGL